MGKKYIFILCGLCLLVIVLLLNMKFFSNTTKQPPLTATQLVKSYAKEKGKSFVVENIPEEEDFNVVVGPIFFRFTASTSELIASGYVASGQVDLTNPKTGQEDWNWLISIASLQPTTLGGGELELYTGEIDPLSKKPAVYLSRKYKTLFPGEKEFIHDMNWLAQMSTYWRDERWQEIFSSRTDEELRKEAAEAEKWAKSQK